ncbi:MAG: WYL domain-containing protein [Eubacteriales bacterium]
MSNEENQEGEEKKKDKSSKSQFEKIYKLIEYLKWNTDKDHRVRQKNLREIEKIKDLLGHKGTFGKNVKRMSEVLNMNEEGGLLELEEWRLVYDGLLRENGYLGEDEEEDEKEELVEGTGHKVGRIYYQQPFSYEEVNYMIQGLLFLDTMETEQCNKIIKKIKKECTTKYYKGANAEVSRVYRKENFDATRLNEKLTIVQQAIKDGVEIEFTFYGYNRHNQLVPNKKKPDRLCPYYLVVNGGNYYLIGCWVTETPKNPNMSIWRVDLMENITIPERNERSHRTGRQILEKHLVGNLPQEWEENFLYTHMNMSFDRPTRIRLRIKSPKEKGNLDKALRADYTFLHDAFGDTFTVKRVEGDYDLVEVRCSPFGMVNWALQYSDRVEVVEPAEVRTVVIGKIKALQKKYGM